MPRPASVQRRKDIYHSKLKGIIADKRIHIIRLSTRDGYRLDAFVHYLSGRHFNNVASVKITYGKFPLNIYIRLLRVFTFARRRIFFDLVAQTVCTKNN